MPDFAYKAIEPGGALIEGQLSAPGRAQALREIEARGLRPIRIEDRAAGAVRQESSAGSAGGWFGRRQRVTPAMLEAFTRLLSSLLAAGVPFSRALLILQREATAPAAKAKWRELHAHVVDGLPLSAAMARSPETFPRVYVAMVEAGETGGFLDAVLAQIADFQAREKELRAKVTAAMVYPTVLLVLAIAVIVFLLVFFIPRFQLVFQGFNAELPLITQLIVGASHLLRQAGLPLLVAAVVGGYFLRRWLRTEAGRRTADQLWLRVPLVGPLVAQYAMARFCRMLGTLLGAGVPLISALGVARRSLGNQVLVDAVGDSIERVRSGEPLGVSLAAQRQLFPGAVVEMISVGEESGRLDRELVRLATTTEGELDQQLKTTVALAEPLLLFLIAAVVGLIFIGMLIPIFSLQDNIR
jgi:type II secretory pathway component PulF